MKSRYRPYDPDQLYLMPPSLREWVPEGDLSHFISDTIDALDVSGFCVQYREDGKGNVPYNPRMMLKVLIYSYSIGLFSSREIAQGLEQNVALRVLGAGNFPNFRTINRFRLENLERFEELFVQVVQIAQEAGLVKLGTIAIDGSKVKANASKRKAMSYARMKEEAERIREEIKELTERAREVDEEDDERYGSKRRGDELPDELRRRESRLKSIEAAKARLEERQKEEDRAKGREEGDHKPENRKGKRRKNFKREFGVPEDKKQDNFTDPESRIMKSSTEGFQQSYNVQIAVDEDQQIIVAADVGNNAADTEYLIPMADQVKRNTGEAPKNLLADSGYKSEHNFKELKDRGLNAYVSLGREGKAATKINDHLSLTKAMKRRLEGPRGKKAYRKRKGIAEPPYGWIKRRLGFDRFSLRGMKKVKPEWFLVCLAMNLKRMNKLMDWEMA